MRRLGAKYTLDELKSMAKGAQKFMKTFRNQLKQRRQEDRRRFAVKFIGGAFALVGICGSIFIFMMNGDLVVPFLL